MADERKNIDKLFSDHLVGHKVNAPAGAWERLQGDLQPRKRGTAFLYVRLAAASLLLVLAFGAGYFLSEYSTNNTNMTATNMEPETVDETAEEASIPPLEISEKEKDFDEAGELDNQQQLVLAETNQETNQNVILAELDQESQKASTTKTETAQETPVPESVTGEQEDGIQEIPESDIVVADVVEEEEIQKEPLDENKTVAVVAESQTDTDEDLENMSPEMLHRLLIGDDEFNDEILAEEQSNINDKWSVGGQISPTYSYRTISGEGFETPDEIIDPSYFNDTENGLRTVGGGISLAYNFNDRLSLGSGLYLSRIGQENNDVVAYDSPDSQYMYKLASSSGTVTINPTRFAKALTPQAASDKDSIPGDYTVNGTFVQNLDYLEVPFVLNYKVLNKRFSINLNGGLSPGILVNNRSYFSIEDEKIQTGTTENIKPMIYNSVLGLGLAYDISQRVSVNLSPTFKYSLSPVNTGSGLNYHPYSFSWFTGISYKL